MWRLSRAPLGVITLHMVGYYPAHLCGAVYLVLPVPRAAYQQYLLVLGGWEKRKPIGVIQYIKGAVSRDSLDLCLFFVSYELLKLCPVQIQKLYVLSFTYIPLYKRTVV